MTKFKVGDRVAFYSMCRQVGKISGFDSSDQTFKFTADGAPENEWVWSHPKQLRKLLSKNKDRTTEIWVNVHDTPNVYAYLTKSIAEYCARASASEVAVRFVRAKVQK